VASALGSCRAIEGQRSTQRVSDQTQFRHSRCSTFYGFNPFFRNDLGVLIGRLSKHYDVRGSPALCDTVVSLYILSGYRSTGRAHGKLAAGTLAC
jgi:hypothetical protein